MCYCTALHCTQQANRQATQIKKAGKQNPPHHSTAHYTGMHRCRCRCMCMCMCKHLPAGTRSPGIPFRRSPRSGILRCGQLQGQAGAGQGRGGEGRLELRGKPTCRGERKGWCAGAGAGAGAAGAAAAAECTFHSIPPQTVAEHAVQVCMYVYTASVTALFRCAAMHCTDGMPCSGRWQVPCCLPGIGANAP